MVKTLNRPRLPINDPDNNSATPDDGSLATVATATGNTLAYGYDELKRISTATTKNAFGTTLFYAGYSYAPHSNGSNRTTNRLAAFAYQKTGDAADWAMVTCCSPMKNIAWGVFNAMSKRLGERLSRIMDFCVQPFNPIPSKTA